MLSLCLTFQGAELTGFEKI